ncbi:hypothetical protein BDY24DRAFT_368355 [Mrakia frigida]|uniref:polynucleotide 5'-hydroxyl-kinase n=1 Tax=Mrakia frigida TaxID=29902 RepID=UPI003FCC0224
MSAPALKKRKKTPKPTPIPPHQPQPTTVASTAAVPPPLSAIAARKAAALLLLSSTPSSSSSSSSRAVSTKDNDYDGDDQDQEALDILNSPVPSSPSSLSSSSSNFSSSSLLNPEPLSLMMDGELVSLGTSRPTASTKQQRKRKGKGKAVARYWDEDLPEMETQGRGRVEFIGRGGETRGWSPSGGRVGGGFDREMGESEEEEEEEVVSEVEEVEEDEEGDEEEEEEEEGVLTPGRAGKRKRDKLAAAAASSAPGGAMSTFLPSFGKNVVRVEEETLRKVFMDVEEGEGAVLVSLKEGENLIFSGLCRLYPVVSSLSVLNATLHPSSSSSSSSAANQPPTPHPVYAPTCYPLPVITPSTYSYASSSTPSPLLEALGLDSEEEDDTFVARFLVRELRTGLEGMGKAVPGFEGIWKGDEAGWGVRGFHPILSQSSHLPHTLPPSWLSSLENSLPRLPRSLQPASEPNDSDDSDDSDEEEEEDAFASFTALIKGPKRSGKSTFARALVNGLLDRYRYVAVLEADLGQGEWGVEGSVSLVVVEKGILGPPFTHPSIPLRSHHIGSPSPRSNPTAYLSAISNLLETYRLNVQYPSSSSPSSSPNDDRNTSMIPLVLNTQGWVKGLGMDLLKKIEEMVGDRVEFEFEVAGGEDGSWEGRIPVEGGWGRLRGKEYGKALARAEGRSGEDEYDDAEVGEQEGFRSSYGQNNQTNNNNGSKISRYILLPIPPSTQSSRFTPSDLRTLSLLSYFHARFQSPLSSSNHHHHHLTHNSIQPSPLATSWDFTLPLVAKRPLTLDWTLGLDGIYLVGPGAEEVEEEEVLRALEQRLLTRATSATSVPFRGSTSSGTVHRGESGRETKLLKTSIRIGDLRWFTGAVELEEEEKLIRDSIWIPQASPEVFLDVHSARSTEEEEQEQQQWDQVHLIIDSLPTRRTLPTRTSSPPTPTRTLVDPLLPTHKHKHHLFLLSSLPPIADRGRRPVLPENKIRARQGFPSERSPKKNRRPRSPRLPQDSHSSTTYGPPRPTSPPTRPLLSRIHRAEELIQVESQVQKNAEESSKNAGTYTGPSWNTGFSHYNEKIGLRQRMGSLDNKGGASFRIPGDDDRSIPFDVIGKVDPMINLTHQRQHDAAQNFSSWPVGAIEGSSNLLSTQTATSHPSSRGRTLQGNLKREATRSSTRRGRAASSQPTQVLDLSLLSSTVAFS